MHSSHVQDRNPLSDADDQPDPGIVCFEDRVGGERRRNEDQRAVGTGLLDRFLNGVEDGEAIDLRPPFAGSTPADEDVLTRTMFLGVRPALLRVKQPGLAGDALTNDFRVLVDEDAHE